MSVPEPLPDLARFMLPSASLAGTAAGRGGRLAALFWAWVEAERGRFALWLAVFLGAGDATYFALPQEPAPYWAGVLPAISLLLLALLRRRPLARAGAASLLAFALGFAAAEGAALRAPPLTRFPSRVVSVSGEVASFEPLAEGGRILLEGAEIDGAPPLARALRLRLGGEAESLAIGARIRLRTYLMPPPGPAYPGAWDLRREDFFHGIGGYGRAMGPVELLAPPPPAPTRLIETLRQKITARITAVLPGERGAIAATLLAGYAHALPEADRAAFRDAGLAHLLAIAGLHMGIVMGFVFWAARLLLTLSEWTALHLPVQPLAALAALAFGFFYMLITGAHVPIERSFAMAALVTLALLLGRRAVSLRGWAIAASAILLASPAELLGVSFEMSFAAVLALISGYEALWPWLFRLRSALLRHLVMLVLTSLLAGLASAPFAASRFGQIQLYFILGNLLAVPLAAFWVMPAGVIALALMPLGLEAPALDAMGAGIGGLLWIARTVAALPAAALPVPAFGAGALVLIALGLLWLCLWRSRLRFAGLLLITFGLGETLLFPRAALLVSAEGRLLALRTAEGAYVYEGGRSGSFLREAWGEYWGVRAWRPLDAAPPERIACRTPDLCLLTPRPGGPVFLFARRPPRGREAEAGETEVPCAGVSLVIAFRDTPLCPAIPRLDAARLAAEGPVGIWIERGGGIRIEYAEAGGAGRRWNRLVPWRAASAPEALPLAPAETLP